MVDNNISRRAMLKIAVGASASISMGTPPMSSDILQPKSLVTRSIPSTGEKIPVVGIGTARRFDAGVSTEERAPLKEVLKEFVKMGGKVVDTAPSYGSAEQVVGDIVKDLNSRGKIFFATKVRKGDISSGTLEVEESFQKLRTKKIDLFQIHNLVGLNVMLPIMYEMKKAGRIRYVGVSTSFNWQYADFIETIKKEDLDFIQVNYSLASRRSAEKILPIAKDRGMAVLINVPFNRGRLFSKVSNHPLPDWAAEIDVYSWAQFFLKYILSYRSVTCVIPGTAKLQYLIDNMGAAHGQIPDSEMRKRMEMFFDKLSS